ncbi:MAG: hypothetical protein AAGE59_00920 [Cyanobacteria bacterium P01_F01_bin.86]
MLRVSVVIFGWVIFNFFDIIRDCFGLPIRLMQPFSDRIMMGFSISSFVWLI